MLQFDIYTYQFTPLVGDTSADPALFNDLPSAEDVMGGKQKVFQNLFTADAGLVFQDSHQIYHHQLLLNYNGILVMRIANNKQIVQEENFEVRRLVNQPSSLIVIDNRGNCQSIAIQKNPTAFSTTKQVANILQTTFNTLLQPHFLSIEIRRRLEQNTFWQIVDRYPEGIKSIRFEFSYPNLPRVSDNVHELFTEMAKEFGADSKYELNAIQGQRLNLNRDNSFLNGLIKASSDSGHEIKMLPYGGTQWQSTGTDSGITTEMNPDLFEGDQRLFDDSYEQIAQKMNPFK